MTDISELNLELNKAGGKVNIASVNRDIVLTIRFENWAASRYVHKLILAELRAGELILHIGGKAAEAARDAVASKT